MQSKLGKLEIALAAARENCRDAEMRNGTMSPEATEVRDRLQVAEANYQTELLACTLD
jgi:hypothetical protein